MHSDVSGDGLYTYSCSKANDGRVAGSPLPTHAVNLSSHVIIKSYTR
jgi:hypothetical protein